MFGGKWVKLNLIGHRLLVLGKQQGAVIAG